jgi:hypothetical protein
VIPTPPFTVRTVLNVVQQHLVEAVDLALRRRFFVADIAALRLFDTAGGAGTKVLVNRELCYIQDQGRNFRFNVYDTRDDDGETVIRPADRTAPTPGRWLRPDMAAPYGRFSQLLLHSVPPAFVDREPGAGLPRYARAVQLFEGDVDEETMIERIQGAPRPAFLIRWQNDAPEPISNRPGCVYAGPLRFVILCVTGNNRSGQEALYGSPLTAEQRESPGLNRMIGDLRYVLANATYGLYPYVERTELGGAEIVIEDLTQRFFVASVDISIFASYHLIDEDLLTFDSMSVQPRLADTAGAGAFPADNYIADGFQLALGPGFTRTLTPGAAVVSGQLVHYAPTALSFPASQDTYLDLRADGHLVQASVPVGGDVPPLSGALRLAQVRTDAAGVVSFTFLCPSLESHSGPYLIS